ncbi:hypothetical protein P7C70_g7647, partial [Phenoliferia sp. Uapishka_3]
MVKAVSFSSDLVKLTPTTDEGAAPVSPQANAITPTLPAPRIKEEEREGSSRGLKIEGPEDLAQGVSAETGGNVDMAKLDNNNGEGGVGSSMASPPLPTPPRKTQAHEQIIKDFLASRTDIIAD